MSKEYEKAMSDLRRLIEIQDFKSEDEIKEFMNGLIGQKIPTFPKEVLNRAEQAQDMVFSAYELPPVKARQAIEQALQLDSNCIEAYEFLGSMEDSVEIASVFYEKGVAIGRQFFCGNYLEEHRGEFWSFHETRPFMRCMQQYADCLYDMGKTRECVTVLEEMIELNPNDNQGVRDQLLLYLIELNEDKRFVKYAKMFQEDAMAFPLFNRALFAFKAEGETENSNTQLQKALKQNKYVAAMLLAKKPVADLPDHYGLGDKTEAAYYTYFAWQIWRQLKDAIHWLKKQSSKAK